MTSWVRSLGARSLIIASVVSAVACGDVNTALEHVSEARHLSADLLVQFTKAADASNRAVMSDADDRSVAAAHEAEQAKLALQKDIDALGPMLNTLGYKAETDALQEFIARYAEYNKIDRSILDLAVENTNLKARRLSFGPAQEAATAFTQALEAVRPMQSSESWHVKALIATAIAGVREIQVLEGPHIADPDDGVMTRIEGEMATSLASSRTALASLVPLVAPASTAHLAAAHEALARFIAVHTEITGLSRRNTNVRSLALSLTQKPPLVAACEASAARLRDELTKRGYPKGR